MRLISLLNSPSFWIFLCVNVIGGSAVAVGLWGEGWSERKLFREDPLDLLPTHSEARKRTRSKRKFELILFGGVVWEVIAAVITTVVSTKEVSDSKERTANAESNIVVLNKATLELAHQYDLSTNALAEANARLAAIRPLRERLIDCLDSIDGRILPLFRMRMRNKFKFDISESDPKWWLLRSLASEPSAGEFIEITQGTTFELDTATGRRMHVWLTLKPALLK